MLIRTEQGFQNFSGLGVSILLAWFMPGLVAASDKVDCSQPVQASLPVSEQDYSETDVVEFTNKYIDRIQRKIEGNWLIPVPRLSDFQCTVFVRQREDGCVIQAAVQSCSGHFELVKSVLSAVRRSSPLPRARSKELFESDLVLTFRRSKSEE